MIEDEDSHLRELIAGEAGCSLAALAATAMLPDGGPRDLSRHMRGVRLAHMRSSITSVSLRILTCSRNVQLVDRWVELGLTVAVLYANIILFVLNSSVVGSCALATFSPFRYIVVYLL